MNIIVKNPVGVLEDCTGINLGICSFKFLVAKSLRVDCIPFGICSLRMRTKPWQRSMRRASFTTSTCLSGY